MSLYVDIEKDLGSFRLRVKTECGEETLALLGASGSGKSMTLRSIAGIVRPDRGRIEVDGVPLFDSERGIDLTPQQRRTGLLFQNYALFPNMTVKQNILCGAHREKDARLREQKAAEIMERFGIAELASRLPSQISGGQQQRAALARILVSGPRILLLDEPFSALDSHLRFRLEREVKHIIRDFGRTVVLVSHDRDEVYRLADRVAVMENGAVASQGTRREVFSSPVTAMGAALTGCKNISRLVREEDGTYLAADWGVRLDLPDLPGDRSAVGIRMHYLAAGPGPNAVTCSVVEVIENPFSYTVILRPEGAEEPASFGWEMDKESWAALRGGTVQVHFPPESLMPLKL